MTERSTASPQVGIVILNYNNYEDTSDCLESLSKLTYEDYDTVVVDNASTDDSLERLKNEHPNNIFIDRQTNSGFAVGYNTGINYWHERDVEYILILNNDVILESNSLRQMVEICGKRRVVTGAIEDTNGDTWYAGGNLYPSLGIARHRKKIRSNEPYETKHLCGALCLFPVDFFEKVGYFDENYFLGVEDVDLSTRIHYSDWEIKLYPEVVAQHKVRGTRGKTPLTYYYIAYGRLYYINNKLGNLDKITARLFFILSTIVRGMVWIYNGSFNIFKGWCLAIYDYYVTGRSKGPEALKEI